MNTGVPLRLYGSGSGQITLSSSATWSLMRLWLTTMHRLTVFLSQWYKSWQNVLGCQQSSLSCLIYFLMCMDFLTFIIPTQASKLFWQLEKCINVTCLLLILFLSRQREEVKKKKSHNLLKNILIYVYVILAVVVFVIYTVKKTF